MRGIVPDWLVVSSAVPPAATAHIPITDFDQTRRLIEQSRAISREFLRPRTGVPPRVGGNRAPGRRVGATMAITDNTIASLDGAPLDLGQFAGKATLIVNVASRCGLTPQYAGLEELHERYKDRGFTVLGVPCNQFAGQEPGSPEEIATFCSTTYGVTFPLTEKVDVNGPDRHPLYQELTETKDADGEAGDVKWNFEKFLIGPDGDVVGRFRPMVAPDAPELVSAIEAVLPG